MNQLPYYVLFQAPLQFYESPDKMIMVACLVNQRSIPCKIYKFLAFQGLKAERLFAESMYPFLKSIFYNRIMKPCRCCDNHKIEFLFIDHPFVISMTTDTGELPESIQDQRRSVAYRCQFSIRMRADNGSMGESHFAQTYYSSS